MGLKTGFPEQAKNKVINILEDNKISYQIFEKDMLIEERDFKKTNTYNKFLNKGMLNYNNQTRLEKIVEKINNLKEKDLKELLDLIENDLSNR